MIKKLLLLLMFICFASTCFAMKVGNVTGDIHEMEQVIFDSGELTETVSSYTVSGLDGYRDKQYTIYELLQSKESSATPNFTINGDDSASYGHQLISAFAGNKYAVRSETAESFNLSYGDINTDTTSFFKIDLNCAEDISTTALISTCLSVSGTTVYSVQKLGSVYNSTDNVESITFHQGSNGIGIGSRFIVTRKVDLTSEPFTRYGALDIKGSVEGAWELIYEEDVAVDTPTLTISGLNGDTDVMYKLDMDLSCLGTNVAYDLKFNGVATTVYGYQYLVGANTTVLANRQIGQGSINMTTSPQDTGEHTMINALIYAKSGKTRVMLYDASCEINGTTIDSISTFGGVWNNTVDEMTSITLTAEPTGGIGGGSKIRLYRLNLSERGL